MHGLPDQMINWGDVSFLEGHPRYHYFNMVDNCWFDKITSSGWTAEVDTFT